MHSKMNIYDAGACSTLDFSLRLLVGDFDLNEFNLRETKTLAGGNARTVSSDDVFVHIFIGIPLILSSFQSAVYGTRMAAWSQS